MTKQLLLMSVGFAFMFFPVRAVDEAGNLDGGEQKHKSIRDLHDALGRLEKAYEQALSSAPDPAAKSKLIVSQKAWIAYRDAVIAYYYPARNEDWGSGTLVMLNEGEVHLIEDRIRVLTPGDIFY